MSIKSSASNEIQTTSNKISPVKSLVKFLDKVYGAVGDYIEDESGSAECLYFQDPSMKDIFNFYPDRVCIDRTFESFEIDLYMHTFFCEDSNGRNYIIAIGFLRKNDIKSLIWLFDTFKKHNPNWRKIKSLVVEPEIKPRDIVKNSFTQPLIIICFYHAITLLQNDINVMKEMIDVPDEQKLRAIELFKNLFYAHSQSDFEIFYQQYLHLSEPLVLYFQETWLSKQNEWRIPLDYCHEDVFLNLNSFLEEFNNAVKSLVAVEKNSIEFIKKIFLIILLKKKEKPSQFLQPVSFLYSRFSPEYQISKALTPYAAKFVIEQLDLSSEISKGLNPLSDVCTFDYLGMSVSATENVCSCNFFLLTMLPCRHIFAVRKSKYICVFDESLVGYSWIMNYYENTLTCMQDHLTHSTDCRIPQDSASRLSLSSHLFEISVPPLLEAPKDVFESRYEVLKKMINAWNEGDDVSLQFKGIQKITEEELVDLCVAGPSKEPTCSQNENVSFQKMNSSNEVHKPQQSRSCRGLVRCARKGLSDFKTTILDGHHINLAYICCTICYTKESCVEWLKKMGFVATSMKCPTCNSEMKSKTVLRLSDGVIWWCPKIGENKKSCAKRSSVRLGSWFEQASMTLEQILIFSYMWVNKFSRRRIVSETGISSSTYVTWNKFHNRVCEEMLNESNPSDEMKGSSNCKNSLDRWLQKHIGQDTFIDFLKDAAYVHQKDSAKCSLSEEKK